MKSELLQINLNDYSTTEWNLCCWRLGRSNATAWAPTDEQNISLKFWAFFNKWQHQHAWMTTCCKWKEVVPMDEEKTGNWERWIRLKTNECLQGHQVLKHSGLFFGGQLKCRPWIGIVEKSSCSARTIIGPGLDCQCIKGSHRLQSVKKIIEVKTLKNQQLGRDIQGDNCDWEQLLEPLRFNGRRNWDMFS